MARVSAGCASLALLAACSSGGRNAAVGPSANYYVNHASPQSYQPPGPPSDPWGPYINAASQRFNVPTSWIRNVMRVESGGNQYMGGHLTVSAAGAMGLMQLEPATYRDMATQYGLGSDPFNPHDNIMAGTAYIHQMYEIFGSPGFLAAYNAGPGRLNQYVNNHVPLPQETQTYLAMIAPRIQGDYPGGSTATEQVAMTIQQPASGNESSAAPAAAAASQDAAISQAALPAPVTTAPMQMTALSSNPTSSLYAPAPQSQSQSQPQPQAHFALIPAAVADTPVEPKRVLSHDAVPTSGGWAIQVGAYNSPDDAKAALGMAELSAVQMLINGRPLVISVDVHGRRFYRARVAGLAREAAVSACDRLSSGPTGCLVLSPDAQS
jgi:cell division septation protein DedD